MTFLTILGVTKILRSFRLFLEWKAGKRIPQSLRFEFLEKFLANNFTLSDAEDNIYEPLNRGDITDFPLLRTILTTLQKPQEHIQQVWHIKKTPFATITSLSELYFRFRI